MRNLFIRLGIGLCLLMGSSPALATDHNSSFNINIVPSPCGYYGCQRPYQPYPYYGYGGYGGYPYSPTPYYGGWNSGWNNGGWNYRGYRKFSMFIGFGGGGFGLGIMATHGWRRFGF